MNYPFKNDEGEEQTGKVFNNMRSKLVTELGQRTRKAEEEDAQRQLNNQRKQREDRLVVVFVINQRTVTLIWHRLFTQILSIS